MNSFKLVHCLICLMFLCGGINAKTIYIRSINDVTQKIIRSNSLYIFDRDLDLQGKKLQIPKNSSVEFRKKLSHGTIIGADTKVFIEGYLSDVGFEGTFCTPVVSYKNFGEFQSDTELLRAMLCLSLSGTTKSILELEPNRIYNIKSRTLSYAHAIYEFDGIANKTIKGNNAIINDLRTRKQVGYKTYDGVFLFSSCSGITIDKLHYQNLNEDFEPVYNDDGVLRYAKGIENQIGYVGPSFILLQRDCDKITVRSNIKGARYGIMSGDYSKFWLCGKFGVKNSRFEVNASHTGYPVAIGLGDSLYIRVISDTHHRAAYLSGISNSTITIRARNIMIAPYHCLLSDTHFSDGDASQSLYKSCYNLNVDVTDTGSDIVTNEDSYCVGFQTYNTDPFLQRTRPLVWKNINIKVKKEKKSPRIGLFSFSRNNPTHHNEPLSIADIFENIHIIAEDLNSSEKWAARIRVSNVATYRNISFVVNAPLSHIICDNANNYEFDFSGSRINTLYYSGNLKLKNGNARREKKMDSTLGVQHYKLNKMK